MALSVPIDARSVVRAVHAAARTGLHNDLVNLPAFLSRRVLWVSALALCGALALAWALKPAQPPQPKAAAERTACPLPVPAQPGPHPGMAWVPPGTVTLGDTVYAEEAPGRREPVAGFWMDRTEVTNDAFAAFVQATGYVTVAERALDAARHPGLPADMQQPGAVVFRRPDSVQGRQDVTQWWQYQPGASWRHPGGPGTDLQGRGSFPVVAVTLEDARAYAQWKGRDLPTEAEWEWAAREASDQPLPQHETPREQPSQANTWQGLFPVVNSADDGFVGLAPVGCYAPNALGLFDLIGNVWELTRDPWTASHAAGRAPAPDEMPSGMRGSAAQVVIKGGSYLCAPNYCMRYRAGARQPQDVDLAVSHLGFRTVLRAPGPAP